MKTRRNGLAMLLVLAVILAVGTTSATAFRYLASSSRTEHFAAANDSFDEGARGVAARALSLLETGHPPSTPYVCITTASVNGETQYFRVTYTSDIFSEWQITVQPTQAGDSSILMPSSFARIYP